jgi:hypothetical protein
VEPVLEFLVEEKDVKKHRQTLGVDWIYTYNRYRVSIKDCDTNCFNGWRQLLVTLYEPYLFDRIPDPR